jgi:hypothetical protein
MAILNPFLVGRQVLVIENHQFRTRVDGSIRQRGHIQISPSGLEVLPQLHRYLLHPLVPVVFGS